MTEDGPRGIGNLPQKDAKLRFRLVVSRTPVTAAGECQLVYGLE